MVSVRPQGRKKVRVVVALGGNALLRRGEAAGAETQRTNVATAVAAIAELARDHEVVVTHGNGPQVGLLALQSDALHEVPPYPLDILGAESEGLIGYLLEQQMINELPELPVATLLTQVLVDADDPAFANPTKPIGPVYDKRTASRLAAERGWTIAPDGDRYRRVVASPEPRSIVELSAIRLLVGAGVLVVCVGGGGIPVTLDEGGRLRGVEAVIDKDLSAALLAAQLGADALLMLTDVPYVEIDWRTQHARPLTHATPSELRTLDFARGSMAPKIEAACRFVEETGGTAAIGALADAPAMLRGERGTQVTAGRADAPRLDPP
jgi:carbamate kinase